MKIQFISIIFFLITSLVYGVDNRSAPNVFSSGSTISSSQMNENFNFLASNYREKTVDCDNGESIASAINAGYNFLTIYGTCDGAFMVYMMDPNPFGISFSDLPNKSINHLIIKGGSENRAAKIVNTSGDMNSFVTTKGFLQLYNLTINDRLNVSDGSVLFIDDVDFEVTNTQDKRLSAYGNSYLSIKNSTITGEVSISTASVANIEKTTFNKVESEDSVFSLDRNSHGETEEVIFNGKVSIYDGSVLEEDDSTINCDNVNHSCVSINQSIFDFSNTTNNCSNINSCISVNSSNIRFNDSSISASSVQYNALELSYGSNASIYNTTINTDGNTSGINLRINSSLDINDSSISTNEGTGMYLNNGSVFHGNNVSIIRNSGTPTVSMGSFSTLKLGGTTSMVGDISCYDSNVKVEIHEEVTNEVDKNSNCNGVSSPSTYSGSNGQNITEIGDTRIISGNLYFDANQSININFDQDFSYVFSAVASSDNKNVFLSITTTNSNATIEKNSTNAININYIIIGRK